MRIQQPIILIGAGRSGTTLLAGILNGHTQIDFRGETSFLVPRLWVEVWDDRFWFNWEQFARTNPTSSRDPLPRISEEIVYQARERAGTAVAELFVSLLGFDPDSRVWGFKELWNGSPNFQYEWPAYDLVFPEAVWLHLIRNPFNFAHSCAQWNCDPLTRSYVEDRLRDWVSMLQWNRRRAVTSRYFEIRFEDLIAAPEACLTPIYRYFGLDWQSSCLEVSKTYVMQSRIRRFDAGKMLSGVDLATVVDSVPGLNHALSELEYSIPEKLNVESLEPELGPQDQSTDLRMSGRRDDNVKHLPRYFLEAKARLADILQAEVSSLHSRLLSRNQSHTVIVPETIRQKTEMLSGPFEKEAGCCWIIRIEHLKEYADHIDEPFRSPVLLLEDGQPLAIPHAPHDEIRMHGAGRYSHWNSYLYFSTSDNSDPNTNGCLYAIRFASENHKLAD